MPQRNAMSLCEVEQAMQQHQDIVGFQASLRSACYDAITEQDVQDIVRNQVKKAKDGDANAIKFVFSQLLGGGQPVVLKQTNIVTDVETAARIAKAQK